MAFGDVDAWLIDLDGTLYKAGWVKLGMALELLLGGLTVAPVLRRFRHVHEEIRDLDAKGDPFRLQLEHAAEALGKPPDVVETIVREWMFRRPAKWIARAKREALFAEIRSFRAQGGKTAVVSDYPARDKLAALGEPELFDVVVASGEPGGPPRLKPDPAGYLRAAEALRVAPARCLVIGDREDADCAAARAAGAQFRLVR